MTSRLDRTIANQFILRIIYVPLLGELLSYQKRNFCVLFRRLSNDCIIKHSSISTTINRGRIVSTSFSQYSQLQKQFRFYVFPCLELSSWGYVHLCVSAVPPSLHFYSTPSVVPRTEICLFFRIGIFYYLQNVFLISIKHLLLVSSSFWKRILVYNISFLLLLFDNFLILMSRVDVHFRMLLLELSWLSSPCNIFISKRVQIIIYNSRFIIAEFGVNFFAVYISSFLMSFSIIIQFFRAFFY